MRKSIRNTVFLLTLTAVGLGSCRPDFLEEKPVNILAPENLYVDKAGFETGLYGIYNLVRRERAGVADSDPNNDIKNGVTMIGVDNAYGNNTSYIERTYNDWGVLNQPGDRYTRQLWEWLYEIVNTTNTMIVRAENPKVTWTAAEKKQIVGEARLLRAWAYRHLTYLWGDVPLNLQESTGSNIRTDWERAPVAEVRRQMEEDWLFAEANLPDEPPVEGRVSKAVAQHYLAELYLTIGNAAKAKEKAQALINNPKYKLITARYGVKRTLPGTPYTDMFIDGNSNRAEGNTEALWTFQNEYLAVAGGNNIMRRWWVNRYERITVAGRAPILITAENGGRGIGRFAPTKWALTLYGATDDRGSAHAWRWYWLMNNPTGLPTGAKLGDTVKININANESLANVAWPNPRKWDWAPNVAEDVQQASGYNDQVYLRLGETYLLLAEAQLKLNETEAAVATLNTLRARAKATPITAAQLTLDFILDERSRELFSEEHRRYTLLRTGKWLERTRLYNKIAGPKITERDQLLPIPQAVIDANLTRALPQNPGY